MIRLALFGASGRMGQTLLALPGEGHQWVACVDRDDSQERLVEALKAADVVVDFSTADALDRLFDALSEQPCALVSGTTGMSDEQSERMAALAERMPVLWASNMSVGVAVLHGLVRRVAEQLADWDVEVVETHHRNKLDAPSGTALTIAAAAAAGRPGATISQGRSGKGLRQDGEIGVQALRGGSVIGYHEVHLFGAGEQLTLAHRAEGREQFAAGALRAALWIAGRPTGRYALDQVLGL